MFVCLSVCLSVSGLAICSLFGMHLIVSKRDGLPLSPVTKEGEHKPGPDDQSIVSACLQQLLQRLVLTQHEPIIIISHDSVFGGSDISGNYGHPVAISTYLLCRNEEI